MSFWALDTNPREIPSPLVGKAAPEFSQPQLYDQEKIFSPADLKGKVWLLNFWASWCSGCKTEHPVLMDLAKSGQVPIYGMDYKDQREEALTWLQRGGNPYSVVGVDDRSLPSVVESLPAPIPFGPMPLGPMR